MCFSPKIQQFIRPIECNEVSLNPFKRQYKIED